MGCTNEIDISGLYDLQFLSYEKAEKQKELSDTFYILHTFRRRFIEIIILDWLVSKTEAQIIRVFKKHPWLYPHTDLLIGPKSSKTHLGAALAEARGA